MLRSLPCHRLEEQLIAAKVGTCTDRVEAPAHPPCTAGTAVGCSRSLQETTGSFPEHCTVIPCSLLYYLQIIPDVIRSVAPVQGLTTEVSFPDGSKNITFKVRLLSDTSVLFVVPQPDLLPAACQRHTAEVTGNDK